MKIYIGADHNGFDFKRELSDYLQKNGYQVVDDGDRKMDPNDDYPQFGGTVAASVLAQSKGDACGILICGSGQGVCIAANRFKGIRAALCWNKEEARAARNDDDCNVLCLPARYVSIQQAVAILDVWLDTPFAGASRFERRIRELDELS